MKKKGADTLLGNIWWVVDPLLTMLVYVILVSVILRSTTEAYPLFIFCAILPWKWFSASVNGAVTSVTTRERIIKQVNFPKLVLPIADAVGGIVNFAFGLIQLTALLVFFYPNHISAWILLIPVVAAVQFVFTLGVAILASAITVFFRDLGNVAGHALRSGKGRHNSVQPLPLVGNREVVGTRAGDRRTGAVEGRAFTLPTKIVNKVAVARSRRRIITRSFGSLVNDEDGGKRNVHREVGVGLSQCRTAVRICPDCQNA